MVHWVSGDLWHISSGDLTPYLSLQISKGRCEEDIQWFGNLHVPSLTNRLNTVHQKRHSLAEAITPLVLKATAWGGSSRPSVHWLGWCRSSPRGWSWQTGTRSVKGCRSKCASLKQINTCRIRFYPHRRRAQVVFPSWTGSSNMLPRSGLRLSWFHSLAENRLIPTQDMRQSLHAESLKGRGWLPLNSRQEIVSPEAWRLIQ